VVCGAYLFILPVDVQAGLKLVAAEVDWEAFPGLGIQDVVEFDSG
jgi:hypothetical protein